MSTPAPLDRCRWWHVIGYEVLMLAELSNVRSTDPSLNIWALGNSISEGRVLHTRNLCDFCTSKHPNDIKPSDLFDDYDTDPKYERLRTLMKRLDQRYGKNVEGSARWAFNKKLAHPTKERGTGFDYSPILKRILPVLQEIINEIQTLRGMPFRLLNPGAASDAPPQRRPHCGTPDGL